MTKFPHFNFHWILYSVFLFWCLLPLNNADSLLKVKIGLYNIFALHTWIMVRNLTSWKRYVNQYAFSTGHGTSTMQWELWAPCTTPVHAPLGPLVTDTEVTVTISPNGCDHVWLVWPYTCISIAHKYHDCNILLFFLFHIPDASWPQGKVWHIFAQLTWQHRKGGEKKKRGEGGGCYCLSLCRLGVCEGPLS